jgi:nicotinate-nucleotide adenylyltransferase
VGQAAESALGLTEVVVVTTNVPPHRSAPVASGYHRFAMVALAIAGRDRWRSSDIELRRSGPSFTADTLRHFHEDGFSANELFFLLGADAFVEIESWREFPAILGQAHFAVVSRPRFSVSELPARLPALASRMRTAAPSEPPAPSVFLIDAETADVSATAIRRRALAGESIAGLVPPAVRQYIERQALYSTGREGVRGDVRHGTHAAGRLHGQD